MSGPYSFGSSPNLSYDYMKANPIVSRTSVTNFVGEPIDTSVSANTYGQPIPISVGNRRIAGDIIWAKPLTQSITSWLSGTTTTYNDVLNDFTQYQAYLPGVQINSTYTASYSYTATFAVSFGFPLDDRPTRLKKLWANSILIYDGVGALPSWIRYYSGTETQTPDPSIVADKGVDAPSYRPHIYVVIDNLSLTPYANSIPTITAEIETAGDSYDYLLVKYSWAPANGRDLDTRTSFEGIDPAIDGITVGWSRDTYIDATGGHTGSGTTPGASFYMQWFQDNTTDGGGEHILFNIKKIREDFPDVGLFDIHFRGFWYAVLRDGNFQVTLDYFKGDFDFTYGGNFLVTTGLTPQKTFVYNFNSQTQQSSDIDGDFLFTTSILPDDAGTTSRYPLSEIITGIAGISGFAPGEVTVTGIDDLVDGAIVDSDFDFRDLLGQLAGAFGFDRIEGPNGIVAIRKPSGVDFVVDRVLTESDILDIEQTAVRSQRSPDSDIPNTVEIRYLDANLDYTYANQIAHRPQFPVRTSAHNSVQTYTIPIVITAAECAGLTARALYALWNERLTHALRLMPSQIDLEPSDIVSFPLNGKTYAAKLSDASIGADYSLQAQCSNVWEFRGDLDADADPTVDLPSASERVRESSVAVIDSTLHSIDDDGPDGFLVIYLAVSPAIPGQAWPGGQAYVSIDGGTSYSPLSPVITSSAVTGDALNALPSVTDPFVTDRTNLLVFTPRAGSFSDLTAATSAELDSGSNLAALGAPGRWELIQFETAALNSNGTVTISNIRRGVRGSEANVGNHAIGDTFVLLNDTGVYRAEIDSGTASGEVDFGDTLYFKAVGVGENPDDIDPITVVMAGNAEKPFAPAALDAVISGPDILLSWERRDRLDPGLHDGNATVPLSDTPESYQIDIMNGATVLRTLTSSTNSKTYLAANIASDFGGMPSSLDFRVYQMSSSDGPGRGFRASATVFL